jgi:hypothetical protein
MRSKIAQIRIMSQSGLVHTFTYPEVNIEFSIASNATQDPGLGTATIHGISVASFQMFEEIEGTEYSKRQTIEILYGTASGDPNFPDRDLEVVFTGKIERARYSFNGGKQTMTIVLGERVNEFFFKAQSISLSKRASVGDLAKVVSEKFGYEVQYEPGSEDVELMPVGRVSETGTLKTILNKNLPKGVWFYNAAGKIVLYRGLKSGTFVINATIGKEILEYPNADTKDGKINVKARIMSNISTGTQLVIPAVSDTIFAVGDSNTGKTRTLVVNNYKMKFSNGVGTMDLECSEKKEE